MARAYSADLRDRVLAAMEAGEHLPAVARRFAVGRSTMQDWVWALSHDGRREAGRMSSYRKPVIAGEAEAALRCMLEGADYQTLVQCRDRLAEKAGVSVHLVTVHRALAWMGWSWKKRTLCVAEQNREDMAQARAAWLTDKEAGVGGISPERLLCLDNCGVLTNMACLHGRAPCAQRARGVAPAGRWKRLTVLGALGLDGIVAAMSVKAATDEAVFPAFLDEVQLPKLQTARPGAVLLMDNLAAHKTPAVRALLDASGFAYRYLPSYTET